jgi:hypothetical protein
MATIRYEQTQLTTANTAVDGTGTIADLVTGGANGSRVDRVYIKAPADTTEGMIRFFVWTGAAWRLIHEEPVTAVDGDALTPFYNATVVLPQVYVGTSQKIGVTTQISETFNILAQITDL